MPYIVIDLSKGLKKAKIIKNKDGTIRLFYSWNSAERELKKYKHANIIGLE